MNGRLRGLVQNCRVYALPKGNLILHLKSTKETNLLYLTSFGPWSRGHTEWSDGCVSSIYCGQIAKIQGAPNALLPHQLSNIAINSE